MTPQEILQKFLSRQMQVVHEEQPVTRFELFHASGEQAERLQIFNVVTGETKSEELASEIYDVAFTDRQTRDLSTPERYGVVALLESNPEPVGQTSFQFEGKASRFGVTFDETEPPNGKGQTAQNMRHTERMHQMMCQMTESTVGSLMTENHRLRQRIVDLEANEDLVRKKRDEVLDMSDERELKNARSLMRAKREDQLGGMVMAIVPSILASFLGKKGMPAAASSATDTAIKAFLSGLEEKEIMGVIQALKPQNQMVLMEVYKNFREGAVKEDQDKPKILRAALEVAS